MKNTTLSEARLRFIQEKMKVSRSYIIETCRLTRVSLARLADYIQREDQRIRNVPVRS